MASDGHFRGSAWPVYALALGAASIYAGLAYLGDLRERVALLLGAHAALAVLMLSCWWVVRARPRLVNVALGAALAFRLISAAGEPRLSDDVYRYVWDGRVQVQGIQPYRHAPDDPALADLRDAAWARINHPELATIYPPLAEMSFALLARLGAGPSGFRLALGLADFGVVLALGALLAGLGRSQASLVLYAWSPLAVLETAGSGHVEPLGVLLLVLAVGWIVENRPWLSTLALAASIDVKLITGLLVPGHLRRAGPRAAILLLVALALPFVPYAVAGGPLVGTGLAAYAQSWERNALVYPAVLGLVTWLDARLPIKGVVEAARYAVGDGWIPWDLLYRHAFPRDVARAAVALALIGLVLYVGRFKLEAPREALLVLGGALLLSPTVHPWYLLWFLPFAAAYEAWAWLAWGLSVPLAYWSAGGNAGAGADVPWFARTIEYAPLLVLLAWGRVRHLIASRA